MRIAVLILGLIGSLVVVMQGFAASALFQAAGADNEAGVAGAGMILGMIGLVGAALVIAFPMATTVMYAIIGLIGYAVAAGGYSDYWVWGTCYLLLAVMAYFGWRGKRKDSRAKSAELARQQARDDRLEALLTQQHAAAQAATATTTDRRCPSCGKVTIRGQAFCGSCGAPVTTAPVAVSGPDAATPTSFFDGIASNKPQ